MYPGGSGRWPGIAGGLYFWVYGARVGLGLFLGICGRFVGLGGGGGGLSMFYRFCGNFTSFSP